MVPACKNVKWFRSLISRWVRRDVGRGDSHAGRDADYARPWPVPVNSFSNARGRCPPWAAGENGSHGSGSKGHRLDTLKAVHLNNSPFWEMKSVYTFKSAFRHGEPKSTLGSELPSTNSKSFLDRADQVREAGLQMSDALDRLRAEEGGFRDRSRAHFPAETPDRWEEMETLQRLPLRVRV